MTEFVRYKPPGADAITISDPEHVECDDGGTWRVFTDGRVITLSPAVATVYERPEVLPDE
jgi:hypothetical protein